MCMCMCVKCVRVCVCVRVHTSTLVDTMVTTASHCSCNEIQTSVYFVKQEIALGIAPVNFPATGV
jgi:hypothetical protein